MKKEIPWINYLRALCVIAVYWIHCGTYCGYEIPYIPTFVQPIYVNGFFFISGYLLFRKQLSAPVVHAPVRVFLKDHGAPYLLGILFRLVIPSVLFSMVTFLPSYLLRGKRIHLLEFLAKTLGGGSYWFISALVVGELIIFLLLLTRRKSIVPYLAACVLCCLLGTFLFAQSFSFFSEYPAFPWHYKNGLLAMIFLGLGGAYWEAEEVLCRCLKPWILLLLTAAYFALLALWPDKFLVLISLGELNVPGICISALGIIVLISLCKKLGNSRILTFIGRNSMVFYFFSGGLPVVLSMIAGKLIPGAPLLGFLLVFTLSLVLSFFGAWFIGKFLPFLLDLRLIRNKR